MRSYLFDFVNQKVWYGDDAGDASNAGDAGNASDAGDTGDAGDAGEGAKERTFTQEEVNRIMAQNRRNLQTKVTELESQLNEAKSGTLTAEEKVKLQTRVKELSDSLKTKEELAKAEQEQLRKESEEKISDLQNQLNTLQDRYTGETITRMISDAAVANDAFAPDQLVAILRPNTSLVEELDKEGNPTGNLVAKTKLLGKDKDDKDTELDLTIAEAVEMMKKIPERYGNLFRATAKSGLGLNGSEGTPSGSEDISKMSTSEYIKARREGKIDLSKL